MSKDVLILASSPRTKGNSEILCEEFARGAREAGHKVELIPLRKKEVKPCVACEACRKNGVCSQKDDMAEILGAMYKAQVIVMATPVYFYTMCAQMKAVIDRTVARYTALSGKEFYFIVTAADDNKAALERTVEGFRGFTDCLSSAKEKGVIYGGGAWQRGDIKSTKAMVEAYTMGGRV